jgi:hypothetical protein
MGGTIASTVLTLLIVPLIYYMTERKKYEGEKEEEVLTNDPVSPEVLEEVIESKN